MTTQITGSNVNRYISNASNSEWGLLSGYFSNEFNSLDSNKNPILMMNDGNNDSATKQSWVNFDRFYSIDLTTEQPSGRHYIFICRPDLYLVEEGSSVAGGITLSSESRVNTDPYFTYLAQFHPEIIASLTSDFAGMKSQTDTNASNVRVGNSVYQLSNHVFMPYLTTRIESLQLPDYKINSNTIVQPYTKYTIPYTTSAIESSTGGTFSINFREDRYYSIHKLFYAWIYYQNNVMKNIFRPKTKYLRYNALDYATSIYDFIVDDTGENIIYWAKYTGCVPIEIPMSDMSFNRNSGAENKTSVDFAYFYCEHMDRNILMDFQYNSLGYTAMNGQFKNNKMNPFPISQTVPIYSENTFLGKNYVGRPVIFYGNDKNKGPVFKLRWLP